MMKLVPLADHDVPTPTPAPYQAGTTLMMATGEVITAHNNNLMLTLPTGGHHDLGIPLDHRDNPTFLPTQDGRHLLLTTLWSVWDIDFARASATQLVGSNVPLESAVPAAGGGIVTMEQVPFRGLALWQAAADGTLQKRWEVKLTDETDGISACGDLPAVLVHGDTYAETAWLVAFDAKGPRPVALLAANVAAVMWDPDTRRLLFLPLDEDGDPTDTWHQLEGAEEAIANALTTAPATGPDDFQAPRVPFEGLGDGPHANDACSQVGRGEAGEVQYATFYERANGLSLDRCVFPAWRYDFAEGISPGRSETWLMASGLTHGSLDVHGHIPSQYHYIAAWLTDDGGLFVADRLNASVYYCPDFDAAKGGTWQHHNVPMNPLGLCGTPDGGMIVWGRFDNACLLFRWNGHTFDLMDVPGFAIHAMHGRASNALWAAGAMGMVAYWNGNSWRAFKTDTNEFLNGIFMCDDGRVYATGSQGSLLRGGIDDGHFEPWMTMIDGPSAGTRFHGVAHWQGALWLAADESGLIRLADGDDKLNLFGPECCAIGVHARDRLIVSCPDKLMDTADGHKWRTAFEGALLAKSAAR
jgi:hypothetical protein